MAGELLEVGVAVAALAVAGGVGRRAGQSVIPVYILTGMAIGPHVAGHPSVGLPYVGASEAAMSFVEVAAELGIVLLLFFLGLEFSVTRLLGNKEKIGRAGTVDLVNL
ncbi:MAG: cation:proton antiporter, partial [Halobacteriota archaeon]